MSADKYAQFIAEQQRKLSVSGINPVELTEKKHMSKTDIAKLKEPKDKIDADDLEALRNKEHLKKEEVEQVDEVRAIQGKHASVTHKAPSITPTRIKQKGKASKPKVQTDLNIMASYEIEADELQQIEEAVKKGDLPSIIDHYKNHEKLHQKLADKHAALASDMHDMGDEDSFEHHYSKSHMHNDEAQRARYKVDHAVALSAKVKARQQMKDAEAAVSKAGRIKREWDR